MQPAIRCVCQYLRVAEQCIQTLTHLFGVFFLFTHNSFCSLHHYKESARKGVSYFTAADRTQWGNGSTGIPRVFQPLVSANVLSSLDIPTLIYV